MKKIFASFVFLFFAVFTIFAQTPTPTPKGKQPKPDEDVVRISTTLIQIDATVTDKNGKIVTDLKPEDFEIYENNKKQNITNFSFVSTAPEISATPTPAPAKNAKNAVPLPPVPLKPEQVRRTIAFAVDDLTLSFESVYYVRRALRKFVDEQMQEGDLVAIIRTGGGIGALQQFSNDKRQLYAAIEKIRWNPTGTGGISAIAPIEATPSQQAQSLGANISDEQLENERNQLQSFKDFQSSIFTTGTLGALNYIIRGMQELPGRKSILLMSDGFKLHVKDESGFSDYSQILNPLRNLTEMANRASVVIYTMDARGLQALGFSAADNTAGMSPQQIAQSFSDRRAQFFDTQEGLGYLAQQTGGFVIKNSNNLSGGIRKILNDLNGYYLLGYMPDEEIFDPKTRRFNKLSVKVKRSGLKVRYRSGYFGVTDENMPTAAVKRTPQQQIISALTSPFAANGIDLRLNALFANDAKAGSYIRSLLHINVGDLKFTDEPDGSHKATFEVLATIFGENGQLIDQVGKSYTLTLKNEKYKEFLKEGFVYNIVFPIKKAGAYQFRIALRDNGSEKVGSANQFIEIPNLKKGNLTLSGIVLENLTLKQFQDLQSNAVPVNNADESRRTPQGDTSLRRFKRGTVLRYGFEIYNAKPGSAQTAQLTMQTRVFRDGKILFKGKPTPVETAGQKDLQRIATVGALSLGSEMQPGDYVLQLVVTDNLAKEKRKIATQFVQFEIVE